MFRSGWGRELPGVVQRGGGFLRGCGSGGLAVRRRGPVHDRRCLRRGNMRRNQDSRLPADHDHASATDLRRWKRRRKSQRRRRTPRRAGSRRHGHVLPAHLRLHRRRQGNGRGWPGHSPVCGWTDGHAGVPSRVTPGKNFSCPVRPGAAPSHSVERAPAAPRRPGSGSMRQVEGERHDRMKDKDRRRWSACRSKSWNPLADTPGRTAARPLDPPMLR